MNIQSKQIIQGGFSEPILQPIYVLTIGTILLLNPFIGLLWATSLVALPSLLIAYKVSKKQDSFSIPVSSIMHIVAIKTNNKYIPNYYELNDFIKINSEVSVPMIKKYFGISRYKAKIIRNEIINFGLAVQKQSSFEKSKNKNTFISQVIIDDLPKLVNASEH